MLLSSASAMPDTPSASAVAVTICLASKYCPPNTMHSFKLDGIERASGRRVFPPTADAYIAIDSAVGLRALIGVPHPLVPFLARGQGKIKALQRYIEIPRLMVVQRTDTNLTWR